jgi:integrase
MVKWRGKTLYIYFKPFGKKIGVKVETNSVREAQQIEGAILRACRTGHYDGLDPISRAACVRMFQNKKWELPPELSGHVAPRPQEELTLWRACELFIKYPEVRDSAGRWRHKIALVHLAEHLGKDTALKSLWVPRLKEYQLERQNDGAAPDTVNRELSTLSCLFGVMIELQHVDANPVRLVKRLSTKSGERQVYLSLETVQEIAGKCPAWYRPILWTAFYSGMRRGELLGLTRKQVNLTKRIITLSPEHTKEAHWKRVPIHRDLVPILRAVLDGPPLISGRVFPLWDDKGIRDLELESFKNVWPRACEALELEEPWPRFHDLRHAWKTNARRSGMDPEIREAILGHSTRQRSVSERYGRISDQELLDAIDSMTFDHGETEILVAGKGNKRETNAGVQRKSGSAL